MICERCKGLTVNELDGEYPKIFHIYQNRCLNCGHIKFDPRTIDSSVQLTKEAVCV